MNIGDRIKNRRLELGLSVDDIAKKIGKNRATIYRYESSEIEDLPTSILEPLAKVLNTTPAYLMGWESHITAESDSDRNRLLSNYELLNTTGKAKLLEYSDDLISSNKYIKSSTQADKINA